jgi:hypothetical protein
MSVTILIVDKKGSIKEQELKTFVEAELYKKAGLKTNEGFVLQTEWGAELDGKTYSVSVYGKTKGRAGQENKYEFPPPIDNLLMFGSCVLVNKVAGKVTSITKEEWKKVYEHLYGGFEDVGDEDSELSEDDVDEDVPRTKEGYVKDDFIVDDEEEEDYEDEEEEEEISSEEEIVKKAKKSKPVKKTEKPVKKEKKGKIQENVFTTVTNEADTFLSCTDELEEEEYI